MNCLEFRRIVGAEPHASAPEIVQHAAECEACARYQRELQQMDRLIHRALSIDPATPAVKAPVRRPPMLRFGLAASVLLAIALAVFWLGAPRDALAADAVQHVMHESASLQEPASAEAEAMLAQVLTDAGVRLRQPLDGRVSYAMFCPFRGHQVPHFVVQTEKGPVTVLLLAHEEAVEKPRHFREKGFHGVIMPAPRGVLAVLGEETQVDRVAQEVLAAVDYQTGW